MTRRLAAVLLVAAVVAACAAPTPTTSGTPSPTTPTPRSPTPPTDRPSPTAAPSPTPPPPSGPRFEVVGDAPIIPRTIFPSTGSILAAGIVHEDDYHAFVVGFSSAPSDHRLYHLTSPDAIAWTPDPAEPLEVAGEVFSHPGAIPTTVLVEDGQWVMYFSAIAAPARLGFDIWRATAPDAAGPWTADPEPVLRRGTSGAWDSGAVDFPAVLRTGEGYLMLYQGGRPTNVAAGWIGLATSPDGATWTKHDDPSTAPREYAQSDPVVSPGHCGGFDDRAVAQPRVWIDGERLVLAYAGYVGPLTATPTVGLSESLDGGVTWSCLQSGSALDPAGLPAGFGMHALAAFERDGTPALLVEWLANDGSDIWLAELADGLP
jgi:hypothetical protein